MSCPQFGLMSMPHSRSVPLKKADVQVSIRGFIANVKSDLHYVNDTDENMETEFVFPLDTDSAVYKFEAEIDNRTIVAEIQEKSQAKQTYQDAVDSGYTAMYMGEYDKAGDIFRVRLGNLPAKMAAKLTFSYVQELDLSSDQTGTFMLPTVLNPRYAPDCSPTDDSKSEECQETTLDTILSEVETLYYSDFTMTLETVVAGGKNLMLSENKMEFDVLADIIENKMSLSKQLKPGSDFSIVLHYKGFEKPGTIFEKGIKDSKNGFLSSDVLMINFSPEFKDLDSELPCEFVFVIDRSGSMTGDRIEKAKETLLLLLKSLPVTCIFNIVSFGTTFSTLFSKSKPYNEENLEEAMHLQRNMRADMGGTEIFKPLENVFKNKPSGSYARQVFLLTDGQVSSVSNIVQLVKEQKNTRVFTFGIGDGCSTDLIRKVAKVSNGKATFVKDEDRLQSKVMSALRCSVQGGIADASLTWTLPEGCTVINAPDEVPPVFPGERLILYAIITGDIPKDFSGKTSLMLTGKVGEKNVSFSMQFDMDSCTHADDSCPLHRLAAKSKLAEMELNMTDENAMVALSTAMNVPCRYTAFVGVDKTMRTALISQDVEMEQYSNESFNLSAYNFTSPKSKHKSGFGEKFVNIFSNIFSKKSMQTKDAHVSRHGPKHTNSASRKGSVERPQSSTSPGALPYLVPDSPRHEKMNYGFHAMSFSSNVRKKKSKPSLGRNERLRTKHFISTDDPDPVTSLMSCELDRSEFSNIDKSNIFIGDSDLKLSLATCGLMGGMPESSLDEDDEPADVVKGTDDSIWKMMQLVKEQKFNGSWQLDSLLKIIKKPEEEIKESAVVKDTDVWATALAIAFLRKELPDKKDEWEMLVEKALKWLKTKDAEGKDVVQEAMAFLSE
ncbi:von Willebrand factor A domain-containing protein 5A-like isoform X2 [Ostrea edulis]|uniref:von Willebrand factor A domain-containing protein 5A-like isoform X2 n=1 Tax=Ostrea edulis TaxID=37623 RepID=UPI0024AF134A|nr:von Willebrand factor A domain-containing protein 5A-like isoform X2 [Ostrea edulis]